jgi:hypothetical protein
MDAHANVTAISLNTINVTSTTFGNVDGKKVAQLLNEGLKFGLPFFNVYLESLKLVIPSSLFNNLFKLSDLTLKYHGNYIEAGLTPTFNPPKYGSNWLPKQERPSYVNSCDTYPITTNIDENGKITVDQCQ